MKGTVLLKSDIEELSCTKNFQEKAVASESQREKGNEMI